MARLLLAPSTLTTPAHPLRETGISVPPAHTSTLTVTKGVVPRVPLHAGLDTNIITGRVALLLDQPSDVESFYARSRSGPGVRGLPRGRGPPSSVTDVVHLVLRHVADSGSWHAVYYPNHHHHHHYWWLPSPAWQELQVSPPANTSAATCSFPPICVLTVLWDALTHLWYVTTCVWLTFIHGRISVTLWSSWPQGHNYCIYPCFIWPFLPLHKHQICNNCRWPEMWARTLLLHDPLWMLAEAVVTIYSLAIYALAGWHWQPLV